MSYRFGVMALVGGGDDAAVGGSDLAARPSLAPKTKSICDQLVSVSAVHRSTPTDLVELARQVETVCSEMND